MEIGRTLYTVSTPWKVQQPPLLEIEIPITVSLSLASRFDTAQFQIGMILAH